jgi:PAS domain S-box-containing protein
MGQLTQDVHNNYKSESNFDLLFDRMPQSLVLSEYDSGRIIKINEFFCLTFGFKAQNIIGKTSLDAGIWDNSNRELFINELNKHHTVNGFELLITNISGEPINVMLFSNLIYINSRKTLLTMVVDISSRKQIEKALQESEVKFRSVFHNNAAPIAIINPDTTIAEVNDAYCRVSGYTREEVVGMSWTQQITEDELDRLKESDHQRFLNPLDLLSEYDTSFYSKQGERKYIHMSISFIPGTKNRIVSFVDTTLPKIAEITLAKQSEELKKLIVSKDREITLNLLQLANNNQFNQQLSANLKKIREQIKSENRPLLHDLDKLIVETASNQQPYNWERLNEHFMLTRPSFLSGLLNKHPNLSPAEQKLCTLLSLQISTKEIAMITNQHYDSVRVSRTRLRKKLGLENANRLVAYLLSL